MVMVAPVAGTETCSSPAPIDGGVRTARVAVPSATARCNESRPRSGAHPCMCAWQCNGLRPGDCAVYTTGRLMPLLWFLMMRSIWLHRRCCDPPGVVYDMYDDDWDGNVDWIVELFIRFL